MAETTWHRHKGFTMVHRDDQCSFSEKQPVLVLPLDGLEETIARAGKAHGVWGFNGTEIACVCDRKWRPNAEHVAHLAHHIARALAGDGAR